MGTAQQGFSKDSARETEGSRHPARCEHEYCLRLKSAHPISKNPPSVRQLPSCGDRGNESLRPGLFSCSSCISRGRLLHGSGLRKRFFGGDVHRSSRTKFFPPKGACPVLFIFHWLNAETFGEDEDEGSSAIFQQR
jgi:hypothetical protein